VKDAFLVKSGHKELSNVKNEEFREWLKDN
jgi:hypothetical protein